MQILFTGASSFTGYWFVRELVRAGHKVTALFRRRPEEYGEPIRRRRVAELRSDCEPLYGCSFGDERFVEVLKSQAWDVLCHHATEAANYRSADYDAVAALQNNTRNLAAVLAAFKAAGGRSVVLTGSVFEADEGAGSEGRAAFSPYGLAKTMTAQMFRYYTQRAGLGLAKFVIPNPFGPLEEPRFTAYLMKTWFAGGVAAVNTPAYVRDNVHVSLLAQVYAEFVHAAPASGEARINPSQYPESQGAFATRFASEMRPRLGLACGLDLKRQTEFPEPRVRINTDLIDAAALGWEEPPAWDEIAGYYRQLHG